MTTETTTVYPAAGTDKGRGLLLFVLAAVLFGVVGLLLVTG